MSNKSFSDSVKVTSPCTESWDQMQGTDKMRFCSHCTKHVNNLSKMTRKEAMKMVEDKGVAVRVRIGEEERTLLIKFPDQPAPFKMND